MSIEQLAEQARNAVIGYQAEGGTGPPPTVPVPVNDLTEATNEPPIPLIQNIKREEKLQEEEQEKQQPALVIQPQADEAAMYVYANPVQEQSQETSRYYCVQ